MRFIGNILWCFLGGGLIALMWLAAGVICCLTVVGIPLGIQCFKFAGFTLFPFGREVRYSENPVDVIWNILWILLFGWELAVFSFILGLACCATIVGIPFGLQAFKFAKLALMPFGATVI